MRNNQPVTQREYLLKDGCAIISHTNTKGQITHFNEEFREASGFSPDELTGQPHNIVRHPDMPAEAFRDLWDTLKRGRPWSGLVKNRRKNGDHYWVLATATPFDGGYKSIRIKTGGAQVAEAEALYAKIRDGARLRLHEGRVYPDNFITKVKLMLEKITLQQRFWLWASFATAIFYLAIGLGWWSLQADRESLRTIHDDRVIPLVQLGDVRDRLNSQRFDVMLALQHDPAGELGALHDHPASVHLDQIASRNEEIDRLWSAYRATYLTEDEKQLAALVEANRAAFSAKLEQTVNALRAGNFGPQVVSGFLATTQNEFNALIGTVRALSAYQEQVADTEYQAAVQRYELDRNVYIGLLLLGAVVGTLMGWSALSRLRQGMRIASEAASTIASGDLTRPVPTSGQDEIGQLLAQMGIMRNNLHELIAEMRGEVERLNQHSRELRDAAGNSAHVAETQSEAASSMAAAVEELSVSIDQVEEHAGDARRTTQDSANRAMESSKVIESAAAEMQNIANVVVETAGGIRDLEEISSEITRIVEVIRDVAEQTNLLALNAAIEAARAGEYGRGFAVVADEVRKLAERTSTSSGEITQMIGKIQESARAAVTAMEVGVARVESGVKLSRGAGDSVGEIRDAQSHITQAVDEIGLSLKEQATATRDIAGRVEKVSQGTEELAATARQTQDSAEQLASLAENLDKLAARFRVA